LPFPFIFGFGNLSAWPFVLVLGLVSTGMAYLFFNLGLEKVEAGFASIIMIIVHPLVAILLAVVIISEELNLRIILGGVLLLLAGIYLEWHKR